MVIEQLTFHVEAALRDRWLEVEGATWSRFLERQPGFVGKQMWVERNDDDVIHAIIWWESDDHWTAVPVADMIHVDAAMGEWYREGTCRTFDVVRSS